MTFLTMKGGCRKRGGEGRKTSPQKKCGAGVEHYKLLIFRRKYCLSVQNIVYYVQNIVYHVRNIVYHAQNIVFLCNISSVRLKQAKCKRDIFRRDIMTYQKSEIRNV